MVNFMQSVVDDTVKVNADFQYKAGMSPKIRRTSTGKCCEWCDKVAGVYEYKDISGKGNNVFRRHRCCRCLVEYDPGDGKVQNVHTKKWSDSDNIEDRINNAKVRQQNDAKRKAERKEKRIKSVENSVNNATIKSDLASRISEHPKMFGAYTPKGLKDAFENAGYEVKPLGKGNFKGIQFEDGGGYRVNFGGDGIIQYHPEKRSHHEGAYYKISTGKEGTKRYDIKGNEKES